MKGQDLINTIKDHNLINTEISMCDIVFRTEDFIHDKCLVLNTTVITNGTCVTDYCKNKKEI